MSLQKYKNNNYILGIDARKGSFASIKTGTVSKQGSPILTNSGTNLDSSNYYKFPTYAIGTKNFTCLVKNATCIGAGTTTPLTTNAGKLRLTIGGNNYDSAVDYNVASKKFAVVADRSGNATFYQDGILLGAVVDISADVATDIATAVYSMQDFDGKQNSEYMYLIIDAIAEVAQLTSELEQLPEQAVSSKTFDHLDGYQFNGTDIYGDLATPLEFRYDQDWSLEYIWKCGSLETQALLSTTSTYMLLLAVGGAFYFYMNAVTNGSSFSSDFEIGKLYEIKAVYSKDTKIVTITRYNITDGLQETITVDLTSAGVWNESIDILGKYTTGDLYFSNGSVYDFKVTINGTEYNRILQNVTMSTALPDYYLDPIVHFKGEMHALANERTIASGQLENLPIKVDSGSFKVNSGCIKGYETREVECVSSGSLKYAGEQPSGDWNCYVDTGTGYAEHVSGIDSAYSAEKVINGDFTDWTDPTIPNNWSKAGTHDASNYVVKSLNGCKLISDGAYIAITQGGILEVGKTYVLKYDIIEHISGNVGFSNPAIVFSTTIGTHEVTFVATHAVSEIKRYSAPANITFDNISIKEVDCVASMNTGDKLIYACKNPKKSLYNKP